ncbi:MAG: gliding motility protein GldN [Bacteroidales bacterium]|nr:gliding motility protein GldN [Bacteroidales bacterium]
MKKIAVLSIVLFALFFAERTQAQIGVGIDAPPPNRFYIRENHIGRVPQEFPWVREADVYMRHRLWRMIDFRQPFNQFFAFPVVPTRDRISFMSMVMQGLESGEFRIFDDMAGDFGRQLTFEEFIAQTTTVIPRQVEDLDNPGQMTWRSDTTTFNTSDVMMLRLKEDWFIDRQRGVRDNRIIGLAPVARRYHVESGEFMGIQTLFWFGYDEARPLLANTDAFNRHNLAAHISYDQVFAFQRFFQSFITKIDNPQGRQLSDFLSGRQLLEEARRIEIELLNLEEDLWVW